MPSTRWRIRSWRHRVQPPLRRVRARGYTFSTVHPLPIPESCSVPGDAREPWAAPPLVFTNLLLQQVACHTELLGPVEPATVGSRGRGAVHVPTWGNPGAGAQADRRGPSRSGSRRIGRQSRHRGVGGGAHGDRGRGRTNGLPLPPRRAASAGSGGHAGGSRARASNRVGRPTRRRDGRTRARRTLDGWADLLAGDRSWTAFGGTAAGQLPPPSSGPAGSAPHRPLPGPPRAVPVRLGYSRCVRDEGGARNGGGVDPWPRAPCLDRGWRPRAPAARWRRRGGCRTMARRKLRAAVSLSHPTCPQNAGAGRQRAFRDGGLPGRRPSGTECRGSGSRVSASEGPGTFRT